VLLPLLVGLLACASVTVSHDYDTEADFAGYRTFGWSAVETPQTGNVELDNPLLQRRVRDAIERVLAAQGYQQLEDHEPDFYVTYHLGVEKRLTSSGMSTSVGSYGRHGGVSVGTGSTVREVDEGTLAIDVIDTQSGELVWRGTGKRRLRDAETPEKTTEAVNRTVEAILAEFPPS
jgi:hypothetical protein